VRVEGYGGGEEKGRGGGYLTPKSKNKLRGTRDRENKTWVVSQFYKKKEAGVKRSLFIHEVGIKNDCQEHKNPCGVGVQTENEDRIKGRKCTLPKKRPKKIQKKGPN